MAVRGVAELAQHPRSQHYPKPGLTAQDRGVRMGAELAGELLLQRRNLGVEVAQDGDQNANDLAVGGRDRLWCGQLRHRQRFVDGHHPRLQVSAPASTDQRLPHRCAG